MASLWEILDPSNLIYDKDEGATEADAGNGPPTAGGEGWIRTGYSGNPTPSGPGVANCSAYTSNGHGAYGTTAFLESHWGNHSAGSVSPAITPYPLTLSTIVPWWFLTSIKCDNLVGVWCVSD